MQGNKRKANDSTSINQAKILTVPFCGRFQLSFMSCHIVGIHQQAVVVQCLHQRALTHEALERRSPPLSNRLQPIQVDVGQEDTGKRRGLGFLGVQLCLYGGL